ncbi:MAG: AAA family ATPase, partial [Planctomycetota bacterium]
DGARRLLTDDDGNVSAWIQRIRRRPLSVLLLDEFEKASTAVHDTMLSVLDEGRITDRFGRMTSLCGCIMMLTSNVGAQRSGSLRFTGDDAASIRHRYERAVAEAFRPEFLNRLDDIITFDPLDQTASAQIVEKELRSLSQRAAMKRHGVTIHWTPDVIDQLLRTGFDEQLGARPLQRTIEQKIVANIARRILENESGETLTIQIAELL